LVIEPAHSIEVNTTVEEAAPRATAVYKIMGHFSGQPHQDDFPRSEPFDGSMDVLEPVAGERIDPRVAVDQSTLEPVIAPSPHEPEQEGASCIASLLAPKKVSSCIGIYF
jgi:hypothetical protein